MSRTTRVDVAEVHRTGAHLTSIVRVRAGEGWGTLVDVERDTGAKFVITVVDDAMRHPRRYGCHGRSAAWIKVDSPPRAVASINALRHRLAA